MDVEGAMSDVVLAVNCGSSTVKVALFDDRTSIASRTFEGSSEKVLPEAMAWVDEAGPRPTMVGHRVVHGGSKYVQHARIGATVLADLHALVPLAPLHMPAALAGIDATMAKFPSLPHVACFDTAFHAGMPELAARLPIPARFAGVRRFGFHGLSYASVLATLGAPLPSRIVIAHLGSGSSLVAIRDGQAIDTTMGFTPDGGIMMGTRAGDLDPGTLVYLMRREGLSPDALERVVTRESGLLAVGGTSDMRVLLSRDDAPAELAVAMFAQGVKKAIGALASALGGIDVLVFTGGIGERAAPVRALACEGLGFIGITLDHDRNAGNDAVISVPPSHLPPENTRHVVVRVIATEEEREIARQTIAVVRS